MAQQPPSLTNFLENAALVAPTDNFDGNTDVVTLMTLHMAKGLEFPIVFLSGMEEGLLPLLRNGEMEDSAEDRQAVEEERRLVYVGLTRAREQLYVLRAKMRRRFGKTELSMPSRFLREIPEMLLLQEDRGDPDWKHSLAETAVIPEQPVLKGPRDDSFQAFEREVSSAFSDEQEVRPRRQSSSRRRDPALQTVVDKLLDVGESQDAPPEFEVGDRVRHATFGAGTVEAVSGSGLSAKVKVHFREAGPRLLLLSLAKLEKL